MKVLFSVVIAVYNTEAYLAEAVESVLSQTVPAQMTEIILVNDGSTDRSDEICQMYASRYPDRIKYIRQENQGVSAARNAGIEASEGDYLSFLDSDDRLENNVLQKVLDFYKKYKDKTDVVSIPLKYFEGRSGGHVLNEKYHSTSLIDLEDNITAIQMHCSSAFIRRTAIGKLRFEKGIRYGEDALFVNQILLKKRTLGVISDTTYWYRYREAGDSAIQKASKSLDYFLTSLKQVPLRLIDICKEAGITCPRFMQYMIAYDIHWRIQRTPPAFLKVLGEEDAVEEVFRKIAVHIDDDIILRHMFLSWRDKEYLLYLKTGHQTSRYLHLVTDSKRHTVFSLYSNYIIGQMENRSVYLQSIRCEKTGVKLAGTWASDFPLDDLTLWIKVKKGREVDSVSYYETTLIDTEISDNYGWGHYLSRPLCFEINVPGIGDGTELSFEIRFREMRICVPLSFGRLYSYMNTPESYTLTDEYFYLKNHDGALEFRKINRKDVLEQEKLYIESVQNQGIRPASAVSEIQSLRNKVLDHFFSEHNNIWVFCDRNDLADDNAECLFNYCMTHQDDFPGTDMFFVLSRSSRHYDRLSSVFPVVDHDSPECRELLLKADAIISSQASITTFNIYGDDYPFYKGLQICRKVFLQHGITMANLTDWLHDWHQHLDLFCTASRYEYDSILNGDYGYTADIVKLCGFPRYDHLKDQRKKNILFMPTWDSTLIKYNAKGKQIYNPDFKNSDLYKEIQDLLSCTELMQAVREHGYRLIIKLHPNLLIQKDDFYYSDDDPVVIADPDIAYRTLFCEGAVLVTDFSSVQFDFAYMKKPVLYYQCRSHHLENDYYDYETMAFGDVYTSIDDLTEAIRYYLQNDCRMKEKYIARVDDFFAYTDRNNCERVMNEIRSLMQ